MAEDKLKEKSRKFYATEVGSVGLFDFEGEVRDKVIAELSGARGREIYARMRADSTVSAIIFAIEMMLRRSKWGCAPKEELDKTCVEYAKFFESLREDMEDTWETFIANVLSMLVYGWSLFEIVAKRRQGEQGEDHSKFDDGKWGVKKLGFRSQDTLDKWLLDDNGNAIGFRQLIMGTKNPGYKEIPLKKCLLFRTAYNQNSPEGLSPLRGAYQPWLFLQGINRAEAYGIERELNGLPVIRIPAEILQAAEEGDDVARRAVDTYTSIVRDLRLNKQAGVLLPSDYYENADGTMTAQKQYDLTLLSSNGTRAINVQAAAERHQVSIARCVLADFLMLGTTSRSGSQALGKSRFDFFANALDGFNDSIASVLNNQLIPVVAKMNGFDMQKLPKYSVESVNPIDAETLVSCILKYVQAGGTLLPDPHIDAAIRSELGLPIADPSLREQMNLNNYDPALDPRNVYPNAGRNPNAQGGNNYWGRNANLQNQGQNQGQNQPRDNEANRRASGQGVNPRQNPVPSSGKKE